MSKANSFGALTDHFSIAALDADLQLVESSAAPRAQERADAPDANEDIAASAYYGNSNSAIQEISCTYVLKSGTLDLSVLNIGELTAGIVAETLAITTANGAWPQLTVSGHKGLQTITAPTGFTNKFTLPAISVLGVKRAQVLGFTVTTGKLTGSGASFSCALAEQPNGVGEPAAHGVSGGTGEVTADFVRIEDTPAWALAVVLTASPFLAEVTQVPGAAEGQASWHTASGAAAFIISRLAAV